ncbi:hypothetical protein HOLleu_07285 [Holothuria leucospilota]|uniref:Uncharacterized protein n=1 Tax=Holothuria leucospilota TaxID=206669 RepID=A0A9Q1CGI2_HOLLE|nr:hypothetical protein HOLleu_07285 [Holothuria leucospilota]
MGEEIAKVRAIAANYPNISDHYNYSEQLLKDATMALHGIILQDIKLGKKELLKDSKFIQGRLYETLTYLLSRQGKDVEQVILEHDHPKLKYLRSRTIIQPKIDLVLAKRKPELVFITATMLRKDSSGYHPDYRSVRTDMARLAYLVLERAVRWGFFIWAGTLEELRHWQLCYNYEELCKAEGTKTSHIVLRRDAMILPRVGHPIPAFYQCRLVLNRIAPEFCVRLYRVEPEMTMWEDKDDDEKRLKEFYKMQSQLHTGYGMWGINEQIRNVRGQVAKVREYVHASLFDHARGLLMMARVMFTDLVVVKTLNAKEIEETDYLKTHMLELRKEIEEGIRRNNPSSEESSSSDE